MIRTRQASINDLDRLVVLFEAYRLFYKMPPASGAAKAFLQDRLSKGDAEIFAAVNEMEIMVGFVQLYPLFSSTRLKRLWLLNDLYVEERYRGKGYALALIEKAKEHCKETAACGLILETAKDNVIGNDLYPRAGFQLDTDHNYYSWDT